MEIYRIEPLCEKRRKISVNEESSHLKKIEKEKQIKHTEHTHKKIKVNNEISEIENTKIIEKINETKNWFLEKMTKTVKPLIRPIR
jgi:hypothetical protein